MIKRTCIVVALALSMGMTAPSCEGKAGLVAKLPAPAYPEGVAVIGDRIYVTGPARFGTAGEGPSYVVAFDVSGTQVWRWDVRGEDLSGEHALSCVASDASGRLYVISTQLGILRIDPRKETQEVYASLPRLATTPPYLPALPNDLAFDARGNLYVTDSLQAVIFRIPPGGGEAAVWFQDPRLVTTNFGPNGIRVDPAGRSLTFDLTFDAGYAGYVYRLPLVEAPTAADLQTVHAYAPGEGPDGIAFGESGNLYVALAGSSQISVLAPDGHELKRFSGPIHSAAGDIPFDGPANLAFGPPGLLFVTNHASTSNIADDMVLFGMTVEDGGGRLFRPRL